MDRKKIYERAYVIAEAIYTNFLFTLFTFRVQFGMCGIASVFYYALYLQLLDRSARCNLCCIFTSINLHIKRKNMQLNPVHIRCTLGFAVFNRSVLNKCVLFVCESCFFTPFRSSSQCISRA